MAGLRQPMSWAMIVAIALGVAVVVGLLVGFLSHLFDLPPFAAPVIIGVVLGVFSAWLIKVGRPNTRGPRPSL